MEVEGLYFEKVNEDFGGRGADLPCFFGPRLA
jgi:hypothetical protein